MFCFRHFKVLALLFKPVAYFELSIIFAYCSRQGSNFILLSMDILMSQSHLLNTFTLDQIVLAHCQKLIDHIRVYFWTLSIPFIQISILMPVQHCLDHCNFVISFKIGNVNSSNFFLLIQDFKTFSGPFNIHVNFRISFTDKSS